MGIKVQPVKQAAWRVIKDELARHQIPPDVFPFWLNELETELAAVRSDPWSENIFNPLRNRRERFQEAATYPAYMGNEYRVLWELAIDRSGDHDVAEVLEVSVVRTHPGLHS